MSNQFQFPEICYVGQRIAKTMFAENGPLTPADRRMFKDDIEEVICSYVLTTENVFLNTWSDGEHEFDSLAVIDISLRKTGKEERISELFHRTMPYPLLLCLNNPEGDTMFSMAEKRFSRDGKEQVVLERMIHTPWETEQTLSAFYAEADFAKFRKNTFLDLYQHYIVLLETLAASNIRESFMWQELHRKNDAMLWLNCIGWRRNWYPCRQRQSAKQRWHGWWS